MSNRKNLCLVLTATLGAVPWLAPLALAQSPVSAPTARTTVVAVLGDVDKSGSFEVKPTDTLTSVLKLAHMRDRKGYTTVKIHRAGTDLTLDSAQLKNEATEDETNPSIQDSDIITVTDVTPRVFVSGVVRKEGFFELPKDGKLSLKEALALTGGIRADVKSPRIFIVNHEASGKRVITFIKDGTVVRFNGTSVNRPAKEDEIILHAGDSIDVWDSTKRQPQKPKSQL